MWNATQESTFEFLTTLLAELADVFSDKMFMVGGDEVDFGCECDDYSCLPLVTLMCSCWLSRMHWSSHAGWESNPAVQKFVSSKGWDKGNQCNRTSGCASKKLESYYAQRLVCHFASNSQSPSLFFANQLGTAHLPVHVDWDLLVK